MQPVAQPPLPEDHDWPEATRRWWAMWAESPLATNLIAVDWLYLLDTALLHAQMWRGNLKVAGELRLRVAAFGATPADRARLRINLVVADEVEERQSSRAQQAVLQRRARLTADPRDVLRAATPESVP